MANPTLISLLEEVCRYFFLNKASQEDGGNKQIALTAAEQALALAREQEHRKNGIWRTKNWQTLCGADDDLVVDLQDGTRHLCMYAIDDKGLVYLRSEDDRRIDPNAIERWLRVPP